MAIITIYITFMTNYTVFPKSYRTLKMNHGKEGMGRIRGFSFFCRWTQINIGFQYCFRTFYIFLCEFILFLCATASLYEVIN